ncbi:MAG: DUF4962 domain-containing protein [Armatimonadota bacterium]
MLQYLLLAGAVLMSEYSGVGVDNLLDKPHRSREVVVSLSGDDLAESAGPGHALADGMLEVGEDTQVRVEVALQPGTYDLRISGRTRRDAVECALAVDGEAVEDAVTLDTEQVQRVIPFSVASEGAHSLSVRFSGEALISEVNVMRLAYEPPRPPMRPELAQTHPRIFITPDDIPRLRDRLEDPRVQRYYRPPGPLMQDPPDSVTTGEAKQFRTLPHHALAYLLTEDPEYLERVVVWLDAAADCPGFTNDLQYEFMLRGVALSYDWLHDDLPEDTRRRTRDLIARLTRQVYEAVIRESGEFGGVNFQQNHCWFAALGLALGGAALYDEVPEAEEWLGWAFDRAERIFMTFSPDGGFHEGAAYWDFSMPTLYRLVDLYESCTGLPIPAGDDGLHGQTQFRFLHLLPGLEETAPLEDTPRWWKRPATRVLMWEAKRFEDPLVMGMADLMYEEPKPWAFEFLWLDESIEPSDPRESLGNAHYYPDVETVFARSGWGEEETWVSLVSRPMGGHRYAELCSRYPRMSGLGHSHPHQGHFLIHGRGETLVDEPGHTYMKETRNHNTILVNGEGQFGNGETWPKPNPGRARITGFANEGDITIAAADPSSAYPDDVGLTRFDRTLAVVGRDLVVVSDRLAAEEPARFSWLLHHYGEVSHDGNEWLIARGDARLTVTAFRPEDFAIHETTYRPVYTLGENDNTPEEDADVSMLDLHTPPAARTTFLVAMQITGAGEQSEPVEHAMETNCEVVRTAEVAIAFRHNDGEMTFRAPWGEAVTTDARCAVARMTDDGRQVVALPAE